MKRASAIIFISIVVFFSCKTMTEDKRGDAKHRQPTPEEIPGPSTQVPPNPDAPKVNCPHLEGRETMIGIDEAQKNWLKNGVLKIPSGKSVLIQNVVELNIPRIEIEANSRLIFDDSPIHLKVKDIMVSGAFIMGSTTCRLDAALTIEFYNDPDEDLDAIFQRSGKGILVTSQGSIDVHGKLFYKSWSRLAKTAEAGTSEISLQDPVNWEVGQKIVVVTSSMRDYPYEDENEVVTIAAVKDKTVIQLKEPLKYRHFAGSEYQVEVGLLSRRIKFTAAPDPRAEAKSFGGHVMIMGDGRIEGVELTRMGQQNFRGRYPLHFHLSGDLKSKPSYMTDNSIWQSYWRCITIHGTNGALISRNVGYDVFGHCYYMEDGVEEGNEISYNLAARVKIMGPTDEKTLKAMSTPEQEGFVQLEDAIFSNPSDRAAAGFYITNANNRLMGNAASGGFAGFTFPNLPRPIGDSRSDKSTLIPKDVPLRKSNFDKNSAHSSGYFWDQSGCIYLGGLLTEYKQAEKFLLRYQSGRPNHDNTRKGLDVFTNTKTFLCETGIVHWGGFSELHGFESHDSGKLAVLFGDSLMHNVLFNGETANRVGLKYKSLSGFARGFQFYDTSTRTIIKNMTFQNIKRLPNASGQRSQNNCAFYNMTHSDEYTPEFMSILAGIKYENVDSSQMFCHDSKGTLASRNFNFLDADGSATGDTRPVIVGSGDVDFWKTDDQCKKNQDWGLWLCPKVNNRDVAAVQVIVPDNSNLPVTLWGVKAKGGKNFYPASPNSRQHFSGPSASGWHIGLNSVPSEVTVQLKNLAENSWLVLSFALPKTGTCSVDGWQNVTSFDALKGSAKDAYWFDSANGYCMVKILGYKTPHAFEKEGLILPEITAFDGTRRFIIRTSCGPDQCTERSAGLPAQMFDM